MLIPVDIASAWPKMEAEARRLLTDPSQAGADSLVKACVEGRAVCLESENGFIITQIKVNPHSNKKQFHIWMGISNSDEGAFERTLPDIEKAARDLGCNEIVFDTIRKGWLRKAPKQGFFLRNIELAKELAA